MLASGRDAVVSSGAEESKRDAENQDDGSRQHRNLQDCFCFELATVDVSAGQGVGITKPRSTDGLVEDGLIGLAG
jgi:hypothetical protein